jgi:hypothetical protein
MALINCKECGTEVSDKARTCVKCGAPLSLDLELLENKSVSTNHILHLLLSLVTVGLWIPFWIAITIGNIWENRSIENKIQKLRS